MKTVAAILLIGLIQGRTLYEDRANSLRVTNYTEAEGGTEVNGDFTFAVKGKPAIVESRLDGLKITGPDMSGVIGTSANPKSFLKKLDVVGGAIVTLNSKMMYAAQIEHSQRLKTPVPAAPKYDNVGELQTESLTYTGDENSGQFMIPGKFNIHFVSQGQEQQQSKTGTVTKGIQQDMTVQGVSGTVSLNPAGVGLTLIKKGQIAGPVTLHMIRTETDLATQKAEPMTVDGSADRIEFDLAGSRTITLVGNVRLSGENPVYAGTSEGDQAVITLDESMKPIKIRITGNPTKGIAREKGSGGK